MKGRLLIGLNLSYPATLERLYIGGVVRLKVVVASNGTVQSTELIGGNPILGQSAVTAVKQWKCRGRVCQILCVNGQVLLLGMGCRGRGRFPFPCSLAVELCCRFHDASLSTDGIRSGHRIVKWFNASRQ